MSPSLDNQVADFVANAYAAAPGVRRWFEAAGLEPGNVQSLPDLNRVPVLSKDRMVALQAEDPPFGGFLGVSMAEVTRVFISPGPLYEAHGVADNWQGAGTALLRKAGFGAESVVLNALGYHLAPGGFLLDGILSAIGATIIPVGVGNPELQIKMMADFQATGYAGTPSWLLTLLNTADEMGIPREAIPLQRALLSAEPLAPGDRQTLVEDLGLTVLNAYATAELGLLAYDLDGNPAMQLVESPIVQIVDSDTGDPVAAGEVGEVVVTNLSATYPLIRFGTGDLAMNLDPDPGNSVQSERLIRLVGRIGDAVKVRGMFVHPNQIRAVLSPFGIETFAAIVDRPEQRDYLTLQVVTSAQSSLDDESLERLRSSFQQICRVRLDVLEIVERVGADPGQIVDKRSWD